MASTPDVLQLKTDAELQFFVENPSYYQPELVAAARRELRRRQPTAAPRPQAAAAAPEAVWTEFDEAPRRRAWLLPGSVTVVLAVAGLGFWSKQQPAATAGRPTPSAGASAEATAPATKTDPLKLETAVSSPLPSYDTEAYVEKALALVPAAEKTNPQVVNQYRAVSRRFWAAQNPTAYLIRQTQQGQDSQVVEAQVNLMLDQWHDLSRVLVYSYQFEPVMADHLDRMKLIAQYQRNALQELANDCGAQNPPHLDSDQTLHEQQEIRRLLAPLAHKPGPSTVHL